MLFFKWTTIVASMVLLQSCSLFPNINKSVPNQSSDIKTIGQDLIKLGDIPKARVDVQSNLPKINNIEGANVDPITNTDSKRHQSKYQQFITQQTLLKNSVPQGIKTRYQLALLEMRNRNWQVAADLLNILINDYPNLSGSYLNKALAHYQLKQFDLAINCLKALEGINSNNPYLYNLLGVVAREQGKFKEAENYYTHALNLWPDYAQAHLNFAVLLELYRGKFSTAKQHYQAYLELKPDDKKIQQWLAGLEIKITSKNRNKY